MPLDVLLNLSERILSSAIVDSILSTALYAPISPVRMADRAVMPMITRPLFPRIATVEWKVGTDITPCISFRLLKYSDQEENPSGTTAMLTSAMAAYANPAITMDATSIPNRPTWTIPRSS